MSIKTQNAIKLFMSLQDLKGSFDPGELPRSLERLLDNILHATNDIIQIRKDMGI